MVSSQYVVKDETDLNNKIAQILMELRQWPSLQQEVENASYTLVQLSKNKPVDALSRREYLGNLNGLHNYLLLILSEQQRKELIDDFMTKASQLCHKGTRLLNQRANYSRIAIHKQEQIKWDRLKTINDFSQVANEKLPSLFNERLARLNDFCLEQEKFISEIKSQKQQEMAEIKEEKSEAQTGQWFWGSLFYYFPSLSNGSIKNTDIESVQLKTIHKT